MRVAPESPANRVSFAPKARIFTRGFTMLELIVIVVVMFLLLAFLLPAMVKAKDKARRISCVGRLKNIGLAHRIFATDSGDLFPWEKSRATTNLANFPNLDGLGPGEQVVRIFQSLSNELSTPKIIVCPADNRREAVTWQGLTTNNISYFLGLSAQETYPQSFLAGDRNLLVNGTPVAGRIDLTNFLNVAWSRAMHKNQGNACMGDGSVQQLSSARLREQMQNTGLTTNTFIFP